MAVTYCRLPVRTGNQIPSQRRSRSRDPRTHALGPKCSRRRGIEADSSIGDLNVRNI